MKRGRSTGAPTKAQLRRWALIQENGCLACQIDGNGAPGCEIHHQLLGGLAGQRRLGHDFTIGLCPWHHRGDVPERFTARAAAAVFGPSLAREPDAFRERYGRDPYLLQLQNEAIA